MTDKSFYSKGSQPQISKDLQEYINSLVEEVLSKGEDFETNRKWLKKYLEAENVSFESYEKDFLDLLQLVQDYRQTQSSAILRMIVSLADNCYISGELLQTFISRKTNEEKEEIELTRVYNGKYGYIDKAGKKIVPYKYDFAYDFSEGLAKVELHGKRGYIDKTGKEIIPLKYDYAGDFSEGLVLMKLHGKHGYVDKTGKEVIPLKYDDAGYFSDGLAVVRLNSKYGYIDKTGKEVIPFKYDRAGYFFEGLAYVELNGKYGYIDKTGNEVIPLKYDYAGDFSEGLAYVKLDGEEFSINKNGECVKELTKSAKKSSLLDTIMHGLFPKGVLR
jgi:hypothetical protein